MKTIKLFLLALVATVVAGCHTVTKAPEKWGFPTTTKEQRTPSGFLWILLLVTMFASGCGTTLWDHQSQTITSGPGGYTVTRTSRSYSGPKTTIKETVLYGGEYVVNDNTGSIEYVTTYEPTAETYEYVSDNDGEVVYTTDGGSEVTYTTQYFVQDNYPEVSFYPGWTGTRWFGGGWGGYGHSSSYQSSCIPSNWRWNQGGDGRHVGTPLYCPPVNGSGNGWHQGGRSGGQGQVFWGGNQGGSHGGGNVVRQGNNQGSRSTSRASSPRASFSNAHGSGKQSHGKR